MLLWIHRLWRKLPIHSKLLVCLITVSVSCMISIFLICVQQMSVAQKESALFSAQRATAQAADSINFRMDILRQSAYSFAYSNEDVRTILSRDYSRIPLNKQTQDYRTLCRILLQIGSTYSQFATDVSLYATDTFCYASLHSDSVIKPFSSLIQNEWYQQMGSPSRFSYFVPPSLNSPIGSVGVVYFISESSDYSKSVGAIQFNTPEILIRQTLEKCLITPNSVCSIYNEKNVLISSTSAQAPLLLRDKNQEKSILFELKIPECHWRMYLWIPESDLTIIQNSGVQLLLLCCIAILLCCFLASSLISRGFSKRLTLLTGRMSLWPEGFQFAPLPMMLPCDQGDEVDMLWTGYNRLLTRIEKLKKENEEQEIMAAKADLALLQTKINPHFLFNTLDFVETILQNGRGEDSQLVIRQLSAFYRQSLNKGKELATLAEELKHIETYIALLRLCFDTTIHVEIRVPEELMNTRMPHLTLQPLIENAYRHGLIHFKNGTGQIILSAVRVDDEVHISVEDNGCGIPAKKLSNLFCEENVGLSNTNRRIRLYFGSDYGLCVESKENEYTKVIIRIPYQKKGDSHAHSDC